MTVYVDGLRKVPAGTPGWRWTSSCHLYADTLEELRTFAGQLGLRPRWFQNGTVLPHYDLPPARRKRAVTLGAQETTRRHLAWTIRRRRARGDSVEPGGTDQCALEGT